MVKKKAVQTGEVRVSKQIQEEEISIDLLLSQDVTNIRRVPVNKVVETPPQPVRQEGDTTIIPVLREVVVKQLLVVEEIHITRTQQQTQHEQQIVLRKEEVKVNRQS